MRRHNLNLSRRPFVNQRPVVRIAALLWALGLILMLLNVWLYWSFYQGQGQTRARLAEIGTAMDREQDRIGELESRLASVDLEAQNEQVEFLNQRIERRTFGWSVLFDTLSEVLPRDVRLTRLRPERGTAAARRERLDTTAGPPQIPLAIDGQAKSPEDLYVFLDALIASPAFRDVNPQREARNEGGTINFALSTIYLPEQAAALKAPPPDETPTEDVSNASGTPVVDGMVTGGAS